jgi:hypothetical protein
MIERKGENWMDVSAIGEGDPDFDRKFWLAQTPEMKFKAAWEMVVFAHVLKGGDPDELRLQRSPVVVRSL